MINSIILYRINQTTRWKFGLPGFLRLDKSQVIILQFRSYGVPQRRLGVQA